MVNNEPDVGLSLVFQHQMVVTERGIELPPDASEIDPRALSRLLRDALPFGQRGSLYLPNSFDLMITVEATVGEAGKSILPNVRSGLDKTDSGQVTQIGVSIILGGSDEQPEDPPGTTSLNPRRIYAKNMGSFDLDTVTANFLLAAGLRLQRERIKTGFSQQTGSADTYSFAREQTARILTGDSEPAIQLNARHGR